MSRRVKVPNLSRRSKSGKISNYNIKNDSMADIRKFYGWTPQQLDQSIRASVRNERQTDIQQRYNEAFNPEKKK